MGRGAVRAKTWPKTPPRQWKAGDWTGCTFCRALFSCPWRSCLSMHCTALHHPYLLAYLTVLTALTVSTVRTLPNLPYLTLGTLVLGIQPLTSLSHLSRLPSASILSPFPPVPVYSRRPDDTLLIPSCSPRPVSVFESSIPSTLGKSRRRFAPRQGAYDLSPLSYRSYLLCMGDCLTSLRSAGSI